VQPGIALLSSTDWTDYELLDSGNGAKLERFGPYTFVRPEHQAIWRPAWSDERWKSAQAVFQATSGDEMGGRWQFRKPVDSWVMAYKCIRFRAQVTSSRHLGVFPEQAANWDWMGALIQRERIQNADRPIHVLNLFGYTGLATLAAAQAGAKVTHVDASKKSVAWARENQSLSKLEDCPIRWIVDDALKFVQREARRQVRYDGILLDPPKFGRGPKGEVWECLEMLPNLLGTCRSILTSQPLFIVITAYAIRTSALSLYNALNEMVSGIGGKIEAGELVVYERSAGRALATAIFARWTKE
jgi:23S rRNA (cytosine1962-C5)-methyltransferase